MYVIKWWRREETFGIPHASSLLHHFITYIVLNRETCVFHTRFTLDGPLHWNVWHHQLSFETSFVLPIGTLPFLFSCWPMGGMKLIWYDIWWCHPSQCNWSLRVCFHSSIRWHVKQRDWFKVISVHSCSLILIFSFNNIRHSWVSPSCFWVWSSNQELSSIPPKGLHGNDAKSSQICHLLTVSAVSWVGRETRI